MLPPPLELFPLGIKIQFSHKHWCCIFVDGSLYIGLILILWTRESMNSQEIVDN
jgi:hypothetical protein